MNDRVKLLAYRVLDHIKAETKMETKMSPETKAAPKPDAKPEPEAPAESEPKADVTALFDMKLGDVLLAGLIKDPKSVAQIVSQAIKDADAPTSDAGTTPDVKPKPQTKAKPKLDPKGKSTPEAKAHPKRAT